MARDTNSELTSLAVHALPGRMQGTAPTMTMIDLFAGCGGLGLGMENAGFMPVFVNELDKHAMETYLANRHHVLAGRPFSELDQLHCHDANALQGERLEQLVRDLAGLDMGLTFPTADEAARGAGASTLDLVAGGPPCQGYSGIGHRRSYAVNKEDLPSNQLYQRMARVIARLRPRLFLFENVKGLLSARWSPGGRHIWPDVLACFREIEGYEVRWSVVRASEYGVPQNRPRLLLVGIRDDVIAGASLVDPSFDSEDAIACHFLPRGNRSAPDIEDVLGDLVDPAMSMAFNTATYPRGAFGTFEYPARGGLTPTQLGFRAPRPGSGATSPAVLVSDHHYSRHRARIVEKFQYMIRHGRIPETAATKKFAQRVLPRRWDARGPTITATSLPDDYVHFSQPRILTVREWARLQTFPDWYQFMGKRTTGGLRRAGNPRAGIFEREVPKYTQIGNAVPPWLARAVGEHFSTVLSAYRLGEQQLEGAEPGQGIAA